MRRVAALLLVLAACSPQTVTDSVARRAARSVVNPVVAQYLPSGQAEAATNCVIDNASAGEISTLARDVGTRAGTSTVQTVTGILARPATMQCLGSQGLPALAGMVGY
ncbi:hypothetical protein [Falsirhodobacter algicola]|uniref:Succinate dehydrogenase n=1 Tax=Falsirhodobacter algicola TaxID=2692330 RepID=A0A8J8MQJ7_9RHOB|nr:hypothetical protein [Falsirhodobacter algicola]QUS34850.1 hypothetical protein GR316_00340 [Falsirhodobacter algicola]